MKFFSVILWLVFLTQYSFAAEPSKIPRTIHWIHLKPTPPSAQDIEAIKSWQKKHPAWIFKLWAQTPCILKNVSIHLLNTTDKDIKAISSSILQKEGGVFIDLNLICCKPIDWLISSQQNFASSDGSLIGCAPGLFHSQKTILSENFFLPSQIFSTEISPSLKTGVCFQRFNQFPALTEELRKIHSTAIERNEETAILAAKLVTIKKLFLASLILIVLNTCFIFYYAPSARLFLSTYWNKKNIRLAGSFFTILSIISVVILASKWLQKEMNSNKEPKEFCSFLKLHPSSQLSSDIDQNRLTTYSDLFSKNFLKASGLSPQTIPRTIHFIWGGKAFPEKSKSNIVSWMKFHPEWTFKFWTDDPLRKVPVETMEKHLFSEVLSPSINRFFSESKNWGEKSDLLRYEILLREGGVYVDHDIECFRSFDPILNSISFFAAMEPLHTSSIDGATVTITNCLIGAQPNHPVLLTTLKEVENRWEAGSKIFPYEDRVSSLLRTLLRTFCAFDHAVSRLTPDCNALILPASWIFPDHYPASFIKDLNRLNLKFANHQWNNSWFEEAPEIASFKLPDRLVKKIHLLNKTFYSSFFCLFYFFLIFLFIFVYQKIAFKFLQIKKHPTRHSQ